MSLQHLFSAVSADQIQKGGAAQEGDKTLQEERRMEGGMF